MKRLEKQLIAENEANDDLTEQLDDAYKAGYKTRQDNLAKAEENKRLQARVEELEQKVKQLEQEASEPSKSDEHVCDSCIDYIKDMKRMELDMKVEHEVRCAFENEVKMLQNRVSELEDENRDRVSLSLSYTEREYAYMREL